MTLGAGTFSGKPVRRVEDPDLLRGAGTYVDNLKIDGMLTLYFVRSPIAHATIRSIDVKAAREMPGVVGVYSADDLDFPDAPGAHDAASRPPSAPRSAKGPVNFVGDPVVVVVAESRALAMDAAELVEIDYEPLGAVIDMEDALDRGLAAAVRVDRQQRHHRVALRQRRPARRRRCRRARPFREPAGGRRAHGGQRHRRRSDRHRLTTSPCTSPARCRT